MAGGPHCAAHRPTPVPAGRPRPLDRGPAVSPAPDGGLEWHDRLVDQVLAEHHGEIMDRAGDGVFAAFDRPDDAVRCAVSLQQRLAAHRVQHGFAPLLRIGVHADRAVPTRGKYTGRGVHLAARVAAIAGPGEIVLTGSTASAAETALHQRREVLLKGLPDPVEIGIVRWD